MALITKQLKVSNKAEKIVADKLGVDRAHFKRLKFVNPNIMRFSFFIINGREMVGTLNYFWDIRKINQFVVLRRFEDKEVKKFRHMNQSGIKDFFGG